MQEQPYELNPTGSVPRLGSIMPIARPAVPVMEPDPNFPLRVQLWVRSIGSSSQSGSHAEGYGNVMGDTPVGFDFANVCPVRLSFGRNGGDVYQARWAEKGLLFLGVGPGGGHAPEERLRDGCWDEGCALQRTGAGGSSASAVEWDQAERSAGPDQQLGRAATAVRSGPI